MNILEEIQTQVFCSQCDFVTSDFVEFHGEFYCQEQCVAFLPTEALFSSEEDFGDAIEADSEWLASAGWGDDEDYGFYGE
jgi:hypothetical protein